MGWRRTCDHLGTSCVHVEVKSGIWLTEREVDVIRVMPKAGGVKQAAALLGIHEQNVKNRLQSARKKLGVSSMLELYLALGWLKIPPQDALQRGSDALR